ncbi:hypothetical protein DPMN_124254 [Dreissena polymorpha]|uniref:Uncharacterized protein n=1 Tax=Dreissena polymorpha TaxID=45954 RepID=A0A9D4GSW4_DREPO|nr:hypothetical protein DPMN_124254 [Dreissena polymorpha]
MGAVRCPPLGPPASSVHAGTSNTSITSGSTTRFEVCVSCSVTMETCRCSSTTSWTCSTRRACSDCRPHLS